MSVKTHKFLKNVMKDNNVEAKKALEEAIGEKIEKKMRQVLIKKQSK